MIQVVNRALDILEFVASDGGRPKLLGKLADGLGLNHATCANIVKTLVVRGYLQKSNGKGYVPGKELYSLINDSFNHKELIEAADKIMEGVTKKLNENTLLAVLKGPNRVVIHKKDTRHLVQAQTPDEKNAWDSSTGRILVAMMDDEALGQYVDTYGLPPVSIWKEAATREKLIKQVALIRKQGYVLIEDTSQITGIAVPVYNKGKLVAAFSIYLPSFRNTKTFRKIMIAESLHAAGEITKRIG